MWRNFSRKFVEKKYWMGIVLPIWVFACFILAQVIIYLISLLLVTFGVSFAGVNESVVSAVYSAITYALMLAMIIGLPWLIKKRETSREEVGLSQLPSWLDVILAPAGLIVYMIFSALLLLFAQNFLTFIDFEQVQDVGFDKLYIQYEYVLAFVTLVVIAPVAEEIIFRGYLLGKLRQYVSTWLAVLIVSLLFAFVHGAWNVGIDVFALSIVLCLLRIFSKSLWPAILLHMMKNFIAFYLLFINPSLLSTLGG